MLTELDAINSMLAATGTAAVTAGNTSHPTYRKAKDKLDEVRGDVLKLGYWFNTSYPTLQPNTDAQVVVPSGTVSVDPVDRTLPYVQRGTRLYNQDTRSYDIPEAVEVRLIEELIFEEMAPSAKTYVKEKARFQFYLDQDGTDPKLSNYRAMAQQAWAEFYRDHLRNRDVNYFDGRNAGTFFRRNRGTNSLLSRR